MEDMSRTLVMLGIFFLYLCLTATVSLVIADERRARDSKGFNPIILFLIIFSPLTIVLFFIYKFGELVYSAVTGE